MTARGASTDAEPCIRRLKLDLFDPDALTEAVQQAEIEHLQLEAGAFRGELLAVQAKSFIINSGCYSRTLRAQGSMPEQTIVVGAILSAVRNGCINGYRFGARDLICFPAGAEPDYLLPAHTHWAALQLPQSLLARLGLSPAPCRQPTVFPASAPGCAPVVRRLMRLVGAGADGAVRDLFNEVKALAADLMRLTDPGRGIAGRPAYAERLRQLRCFEQFVGGRIGDDLRIPALCDAIGIAQRTLEQSFQDQLGISPRR